MLSVEAIVVDGEFYERMLPAYHPYSPCQWASVRYLT